MRVSSLVGAAEDAPPPHAQHTHARAHTCSSAGLSSVDCSTHTRARTLAPTLVGADVLGGPLHLPVLPLTSLSPPPRLKKYKKREKACQRILSCAYTQMVELVSTKPKRCPGASVSCFYNSRT